eukprot:XP_001690834.1 predicted protein [Chlamydomonas reinhardtii]
MRNALVFQARASRSRVAGPPGGALAYSIEPFMGCLKLALEVAVTCACWTGCCVN